MCPERWPGAHFVDSRSPESYSGAHCTTQKCPEPYSGAHVVAPRSEPYSGAHAVDPMYIFSKMLTFLQIRVFSFLCRYEKKLAIVQTQKGETDPG